MRGDGSYSERLFATMKLEGFVPANYPLRPIRKRVNNAVAEMYAGFGDVRMPGGCAATSCADGEGWTRASGLDTVPPTHQRLAGDQRSPIIEQEREQACDPLAESDDHALPSASSQAKY